MGERGEWRERGGGVEWKGQQGEGRAVEGSEGSGGGMEWRGVGGERGVEWRGGE